jgi:hypothetical protein
VSAADTIEFRRLVGAVGVGQGDVVVADRDARAVWRLGPRGQLVQSLISKGRGPGEAEDIHRVFVVGDTVVVSEGHIAVQVVPPGGTPRRTIFPRSSNYLRGVVLGALSTRQFVVVLRRLRAGLPSDIRNSLADSLLVGMLDTRDSSTRVLASIPESPKFPLRQGGRPSNPLGYAARPLVAVGRARVCWAYTAAFAITCLDATSGRSYQIKAAHVGKRVSPTDRRAYIDAELKRLGAAGDPGSLAAYRVRVAEQTQFASSFPAISQLLFSDTGELWVREYSREDGYNFFVDVNTTSTPSRWLVFRATGQLVADCTLPPRFTPTWIGHERIVGVSRDEDDVERVVVLGVTR